ncbi:MAG: glycosyltransferase family 9 protein [Flavobacteriaceae bacterium]
MAANDQAEIYNSSASEESAHLLIIRLSAMGDVAMTVPVIHALLQKYPNLKVTVLTRGFFEPMFSSLKQVSVYKADLKGRHKGLIGLWKLYRELVKEQPHFVADLHNVLRSKLLRFFFSFTSIPLAHIDKGRKEKKALTAATNKRFEPLKSTHKRYAEVFEALGFKFQIEGANFQPPRALSQEVQEISGAHDKRWIGVAPFAAFRGKMYPMDQMISVIDELNNTNKYKIFLFGGGSEEIRQLEPLEQRFDHVISVAGKLKFTQELELISALDLMLSMDSGNGHLAAMFGIPTVTMWGVTHPYAGFYPFGQDPNNALLSNREQFPLIPTSVYGNKYPEGYDNTMTTIKPEQVVRKILEVLSQTAL